MGADNGPPITRQHVFLSDVELPLSRAALFHAVQLIYHKTSVA